MPVPTRIIPFLVGNPHKLSFVTVTGWGEDPSYRYFNIISLYLQIGSRCLFSGIGISYGLISLFFNEQFLCFTCNMIFSYICLHIKINLEDNVLQDLPESVLLLQLGLRVYLLTTHFKH